MWWCENVDGGDRAASVRACAVQAGWEAMVGAPGTCGCIVTYDPSVTIATAPAPPLSSSVANDKEPAPSPPDTTSTFREAADAGDPDGVVPAELPPVAGAVDDPGLLVAPPPFLSLFFRSATAALAFCFWAFLLWMTTWAPWRGSEKPNTTGEGGLSTDAKGHDQRDRPGRDRPTRNPVTAAVCVRRSG